MKPSKRLIFALLVLALVLVGCQSTPVQTVTQTTPTVPADLAGGDYWMLVSQAQDDYAAGDYAKAMELTRLAVEVNPTDNTAWALYTQASVANAGDTYLQKLPDHRYRLPVDVFIRDRINHSRDWFVIDVRDPEEYAVGHIEGAVNIPFHEILQYLDELPTSKTAPILLYCHTQKRATHGLVVLHELGYLNVFNLEGGYAAYEDWMRNNLLPTPGPTPTPGPEEPDFGC